jgi:hypothetical protein
MADAQGQQDAARKAQEAQRRPSEPRRQSPDEMNRAAAQLASLGADTVSAWAEMNQRVGQDMARMTSTAVEEAARTTSEIQQATFAAWRDAQSAAYRWYALWPEAFRDPMRWYQHAFEQTVGSIQEAIDLNRRNAETAVRSFDRLHSQSEEAARTMEDTFKQGASKIRDIQSKTETMRVA